jgi:hypothetical protein
MVKQSGTNQIEIDVRQLFLAAFPVVGNVRLSGILLRESG